MVGAGVRVKYVLSSMGIGRWMVWEAWTLDGGQGGWAGLMITLVLKVAWSKVETSYSPEYLAEAMFIVAKWGRGLEETGASSGRQSC